MTENKISKCDDIDTSISKIRNAVECLEKPSSFESLSVQELRWLKSHKSSLFGLAKRIDDLLQKTFSEEK